MRYYDEQREYDRAYLDGQIDAFATVLFEIKNNNLEGQMLWERLEELRKDAEKERRRT